MEDDPYKRPEGLRASPDPTDPNDPTTATAALLEHAAWRSEVARGGAWVELNLP